MTTILPAPPAGRAFEPTLAIDPANPDRMIAGAMRGILPHEPRTGIWTWQSTDGGKTWTGGPLQTPRVPGDTGAQVFAADVVAGFSLDGTPLFTTIAGVGGPIGTFVSRMPGLPDSATSVPVVVNAPDSATGATAFYDKPWMIVDHLDGSPHRGNVYMSSGKLMMHAMPERLGEPWGGPLDTRLVVATSRDSGRTFSPEVQVSDSAFAGQLAVTPGGVLEVTYARLVNMQGSGNAIFHRRSTDGGSTFSAPEAVTIVTGDTLLDLPVLAARPNGDLLACWSQGVRSNELTNQVRCAVRPVSGAWSRLGPVDPLLPVGMAEGWAAITGTEKGWYLLLYQVSQAHTQVVLYRGEDGTVFTPVTILAANDSLGLDRFCLNGVTPCRRSRADGFSLGDYVAIDAKGGRIAAAFVLPRRAGARPDSAVVYVSVLTEP